MQATHGTMYKPKGVVETKRILKLVGKLTITPDCIYILQNMDAIIIQ